MHGTSAYAAMTSIRFIFITHISSTWTCTTSVLVKPALNNVAQLVSNHS